MEEIPFDIFLNIGNDLCNETNFTKIQNATFKSGAG